MRVRVNKASAWIYAEDFLDGIKKCEQIYDDVLKETGDRWLASLIDSRNDRKRRDLIDELAHLEVDELDLDALFETACQTCGRCGQTDILDNFKEYARLIIKESKNA